MSFKEIPTDNSRSVEDEDGNVRPIGDFVFEDDHLESVPEDYDEFLDEEEQALKDALEEQTLGMPPEVADVLQRRSAEEARLKAMGLREDRIKHKLTPFVIELAKLGARGIDISGAIEPEKEIISEADERAIDRLVDSGQFSYDSARRHVLGHS